ncbi:MAG: hypothetical protein IIC10_10085 [Proteobacteria bacterium]|nr:hypothetical protein [Pseudomonadota bacterium]
MKELDLSVIKEHGMMSEYGDKAMNYVVFEGIELDAAREKSREYFLAKIAQKKGK